MTAIDRLTFLAEWKDSYSSINWKFNLFFYTSDETLELYDLLKHRLFLKRTKCEGITMEDLFIGAVLRICSRLMYIKDYADSYTRSKMESFSQKTCGLLKPEIGNKKGEILQSFVDSKLKIINLKMIQLTELDACELLREYEDESVLRSVIEHFVSGPVVAFQLLGTSAVNKVLELVGPDDPETARTNNPDSLRARYGVNKIQNGIHVSMSIESAEKDAAILFNLNGSRIHHSPCVLLKNTICCIIKPHAVKECKTGDIMAMIERSGYEITGINMCTLNIEQAEKFHEVYKYIVPEYQAMVQELSYGPCIALEIRSQSEKESISKFRELIGPFNLETAKLIRPDTIRARFGKTQVQNSVHVTDLVEDAIKEVEYLFRTIG